MNNKIRVSLGLAALLALVLSLTACPTIDLSKLTDEELVASGTEFWNGNKPEDARLYWNAIKEEKLRTRYLKYLDDLAAFEQAIVVVETKAKDPKVRVAKDADGLIKRYKSFPKELKVPALYRDNLVGVAVRGVEEYVLFGPVSAASELIRNTESITGPNAAFDPYRPMIASYNNIAAQEAKAAKIVEDAEAKADFNEKIATYEEGIAAYTRAEDTAAKEIKRLNVDEESAFADLSGKLRKKRGEARVAMEKALRERQSSYKERIGEVFARQPDPNKVGNMKPADILAFNEETRRQIDELQAEIVAFSSKYPKVIDQDMLNDVAAEKQKLTARINQITQEIRVAKDIESRGKIAMPLLIGLFNPQPATKAEERKSRPAKLRGKVTGAADYWWGMVSIDPGSLNDLVVTMQDSREVQIFSDNTLSGTAIEKKGLSNLVQKQYKVGNSWPVINAGKALPKGQYYLQLNKGSKPDYTGEVVIYKSFIARMR